MVVFVGKYDCYKAAVEERRPPPKEVGELVSFSVKRSLALKSKYLGLSHSVTSFQIVHHNTIEIRLTDCFDPDLYPTVDWFLNRSTVWFDIEQHSKIKCVLYVSFSSLFMHLWFFFWHFAFCCLIASSRNAWREPWPSYSRRDIRLRGIHPNPTHVSHTTASLSHRLDGRVQPPPHIVAGHHGAQGSAQRPFF